MTEKRFYVDKSGDFRDTKTGNIIVDFGYSFNGMDCKMILDLLNKLNDENEQLKKQLESKEKAHTRCDELYQKLYDENEQLKQTLRMVEKRADKVYEENEELKIRNKGKQAFIDKQDKIIRLLYNQCKDFKEILDDSNITYPIDERLNKFFEEGVKL